MGTQGTLSYSKHAHTHTHLRHNMHWVVQACWKQTCCVWGSAFSLRQVCCDKHLFFRAIVLWQHTRTNTHTQKYRHTHRLSYRSHYNTVVKMIQSGRWRLWSICWTGHLLSRCVKRRMSPYLQYKEMLYYFSSWPSSRPSIETCISKNSWSIIFFYIAQLSLIWYTLYTVYIYTLVPLCAIALIVIARLM